MYEITKGYKQGRSVLFYDLADVNSKETQEKVDKDTVVKLAEAGEVKNTKIQWWQGKAIVRSTDKFDILKLNDNGDVVGQAPVVTRSRSGVKSAAQVCKEVYNEYSPENSIDVSDKATVVGNLKTTKRKKSEKVFAGYDMANVREARENKPDFKFNADSTIGSMIMDMIKDFGLKDTETYYQQLAKKVDMNKKVETTNKAMVAGIQRSVATYLMNMANLETRETYLKYTV